MEMDLASDIKLERSSNNSLVGSKRKLEVKSEPYQLSDLSQCEPQNKRMRLSTSESRASSKDDFPVLEIPDSTTHSSKPTECNNIPTNSITDTNNNNTSYGMMGSNVSPHTQYMLPHHPPHHQAPHPQYFLPMGGMVPHHMPHHPLSPYGHPLSFPPPHMNPAYLHHAPYGQYHPRAAGRSIKLQNDKKSKKRKRSSWNRNKKGKSEDISQDTNTESLDDEITTNNKLMTDRSPFKTTYISPEEEIELKNTNSTLYSQFHHARQAIYQQYKQKTQAIRHSNLLTQEKRKLNMKMAAIDAKVQEKKLFISYLEMSKPQPNSWLVSNTALSMNAFAQKITHQTQTPASYSKPARNIAINDGANNKDETKDNQEEKAAVLKQTENKPKHVTTAKRVKKPKFSEYNVRVLRDWYETHTSNPYPSSSEKHLMCQLTGLTKYQVSRWFCNVRTRKPPPELSDNDEDIIQNIKRKGGSANSNDNEYNDYTDYYSHLHAQAHHPVHPLSYHPHSPHFNLHQHLGAMNLPPITPMTITPTPMNMNHFNFNHPSINIPKQQSSESSINNMIDVNPEGLMPSINSDFNINQNTNLMPPPLIDDDSRDQN